MVANEIVQNGHDNYFKYDEKKHGSQGFLRTDDFMFQGSHTDYVKTPDKIMAKGKINFKELPKSPE